MKQKTLIYKNKEAEGPHNVLPTSGGGRPTVFCILHCPRRTIQFFLQNRCHRIPPTLCLMDLDDTKMLES